MRGLMAFFVCMAALVASGAHAATDTQNCATAPQIASQMRDMVNQQRKANGLSQLKADQRLDQAAQNHACDMARKGYFSHTEPNGSTATIRVKQTGYRSCVTAENISYGWRELPQAMTDLINSPGHRANILRKNVRAIGVGYVPRQGNVGPWYVQVFAKPC
jgi:uncharacterized protein YkwD